jgi:mono/diheme cytochrome c family protein
MKRYGLALVIAAFALSGTPDGTAQEPRTSAEKQPASAPSLDGGRVFQRYCGQCHAERYPTERTKDQWVLIAFHMRVRGQLSGAEAEAALEYLQNNARKKEEQTPQPKEKE